MSVGQQWRRLGVGKRVVVVLLGLIIGVNVLAGAIGALVGGGTPGGPASSAYATGADGMAGWADLLHAEGYRVTPLRVVPSKAGLHRDATLIIADPDFLEQADAVAVVQFVAGGGRLVLVGQSSTALLSLMAGHSVGWQHDGVDHPVPLVPAPETASVSGVEGSGTGSYTDVGGLTRALGSGGRTTMVVASGGVETTGNGRVVAVADSGIFQNAHLAQRDNATLARQVVGPTSRPVVFLETVHGYGQAVGLSALPLSWRWTALGVLLVVLAGIWSAGQRFGPPELASREFEPARREYVDALVADLARAQPDPSVVGPLQDHLRRHLAARTGQPADDPRRLFAASVASGLSAEDLEMAFRAPVTHEDVVSVGQAISRLESPHQRQEQLHE